MHRRSSGSPVEDDTEDSLIPRTSFDPSHAPNTFDPPEKSRPQVARTSTSFDLRRQDSTGAATPRPRNSGLWRTLSSTSTVTLAANEPKPSSLMIPLASQRLPMESSPEAHQRARSSRLRSPWTCSILTALTTLLASVFLFSILRSFSARQTGGDGCGIPVMSPAFLPMEGFDTEHTRFASKYNLYLYREAGVDGYNRDNFGVSVLKLARKVVNSLIVNRV